MLIVLPILFTLLMLLTLLPPLTLFTLLRLLTMLINSMNTAFTVFTASLLKHFIQNGIYLWIVRRSTPRHSTPQTFTTSDIALLSMFDCFKYHQ